MNLLVKSSVSLYPDFFLRTDTHIKMKQTIVYVLICSESLFPSEQSQISWENVLPAVCFLKICFKAQCKKISTQYTSILYFLKDHTFLHSIF